MTSSEYYGSLYDPRFWHSYMSQEAWIVTDPTCPRQMHLVDLVSVWLPTAVACLYQQGTSTPAGTTQSVPSYTPGYLRPRRTPARGSAAKMAKFDAGCRKCGTVIYNTIFCHFVLPLLPQLPVFKCVRLHLVASILHASPPFSEVIWYV